jgi:choline dehydrogenase-like flavoprotein
MVLSFARFLRIPLTLGGWHPIQSKEMGMQTSTRKSYDVLVVGSGAGGGVVAHVLALSGAKVCMLEAGDWFDCTKQSEMLRWPYDVPHRAASTKEKSFGYFDACVGGWELKGEPYVNGPGSVWRWWRARMLGGRTNHYGRVSLRMGPDDFRGYSIDGRGDNWPITYEELAPYYDKAETLIGVFGSKEGIENAPDGKFLPPPAPRAYEKVFQYACGKLSIPCVAARMAILTRPLGDRPACHYCGQCDRSCLVNANFNSPGVHIFPAMKTGNLEVRTGAMVREVRVGADGLATGVSYIDKKSRRDVEVDGKIVVLAASACESARILLNSKSTLFPTGVGNSSGVVGKNLMDTVSTTLEGYMPVLQDLPPFNEDGVAGSHVYIPWWLGKQQKSGALPFPRGYHIQVYGGRYQPDAYALQGTERIIGGGYGLELKRNLRKIFGCGVSFQGLGEMLPSPDCYCEIDRDMVDEFGIPVLRFHFKWGQDEILQARHMRESFHEILEAAGGVVTTVTANDPSGGMTHGGEVIHEVGATRMGNDPKTSALNSHCQAWDCKNLFVADGGPFVTNSDKNPTLTISALGWRTAEFIVEEVKKRNLAT